MSPKIYNCVGRNNHVGWNLGGILAKKSPFSPLKIQIFLKRQKTYIWWQNFCQNLIIMQAPIRTCRLENFPKNNKRGGTVIRNPRVIAKQLIIATVLSSSVQVKKIPRSHFTLGLVCTTMNRPLAVKNLILFIYSLLSITATFDANMDTIAVRLSIPLVDLGNVLDLTKVHNLPLVMSNSNTLKSAARWLSVPKNC